ncbi:MAG: hypothetical protein R2798_04490 [Chitinophagales bacterium]|nr:hypothetical protein [Bacteroidota bacterium]MCB9044309.1 hypothetical protein [Chitinophagales bacterium]
MIAMLYNLVAIFLIVGIFFMKNISMQIKVFLIIGTIIMQLLVLVLLPLGNRRFLQSVVFDSDTENLKLVSSVKNVENNYPISAINDLKIIDAIGFGSNKGGFPNKNFVILIKDKLQPQIFEIRNEAELNTANEIMHSIKAKLAMS